MTIKIQELDQLQLFWKYTEFYHLVLVAVHENSVSGTIGKKKQTTP